MGPRITFCKKPGETEGEDKKYIFKSGVDKCIRLWKAEDVPQKYKEYIGEFDDVNWVALVPLALRGSNLDLFESVAFDAGMEPRVLETNIGTFYVGRHA